MALLSSKDQLDAVDDRKWEDVEVPEWGCEVRILGLSGTERDAYEASFVRMGPNGKPVGRNMKDTRARLLVRCIVDEHFKRVYGDGDVAILGRHNGAVLEKLADAARRLSGIGEGDAEAKAGNSGSGRSAASTSD